MNCIVGAVVPRLFRYQYAYSFDNALYYTDQNGSIDSVEVRIQ